jgi:hypothetical protein
MKDQDLIEGYVDPQVQQAVRELLMLERDREQEEECPPTLPSRERP